MSNMNFKRNNAYGSIYYAGPSAGTSLNVNESIALAETLRDKYGKLEKIDSDIATIERTVNRPIVCTNKQRAWFRYFSPFLIAGGATYLVLGVIGITTRIEEEDRLFVYWLFNIANYILPILIVGIGAICATVKHKAAKESTDAVSDYVTQRRVQEITRCEELRKSRANLYMEVSQFNELIPERFRNSSSMFKAKNLLEENNVQNFKEALELMARMSSGEYQL